MNSRQRRKKRRSIGRNGFYLQSQQLPYLPPNRYDKDGVDILSKGIRKDVTEADVIKMLDEMMKERGDVVKREGGVTTINTGGKGGVIISFLAGGEFDKKLNDMLRKDFGGE